MFIERVVHFAGGLLLLAVVSIPSLTKMQLEAEAVECDSRRLGIASLTRRSDRVCPRGQSPYLYRVSNDSVVVMHCPNGHGENNLPMHAWVHIDIYQQRLF
jgi:hypothetical protein